MKKRNLFAFAQKHNPELLQALDAGIVVTLHGQQKSNAEDLEKLDRRLDKSTRDLGSEEGVKRVVKMLDFASRVEGLLPKLVTPERTEIESHSIDASTTGRRTTSDVDPQDISPQHRLQIIQEYEAESEGWKADLLRKSEDWKVEMERQLSDAWRSRVRKAEEEAEETREDAEAAKRDLATAVQDAESRIQKRLEEKVRKDMDKLKGEIRTVKARLQERDLQLEKERCAREVAEKSARIREEDRDNEVRLRRRAEYDRDRAIQQEAFTNDAEDMHIRTAQQDAELYAANLAESAFENLILEETLVATADQLVKTQAALALEEDEVDEKRDMVIKLYKRVWALQSLTTDDESDGKTTDCDTGKDVNKKRKLGR